MPPIRRRVAPDLPAEALVKLVHHHYPSPILALDGLLGWQKVPPQFPACFVDHLDP